MVSSTAWRTTPSATKEWPDRQPIRLPLDGHSRLIATLESWAGFGPCFTLAVAASLCAVLEARSTPKPFDRADQTQLQNGRPLSFTTPSAKLAPRLTDRHIVTHGISTTPLGWSTSTGPGTSAKP